MMNMFVKMMNTLGKFRVIILWVRASKSWRHLRSFPWRQRGFHFRTFQTNINLLIFFDLWTCSPWKCNIIWLFQFFGIATYAYCPWVYADANNLLNRAVIFVLIDSWNPFYMQNENEKERIDDVFVIVIVYVLVRNFPMTMTYSWLWRIHHFDEHVHHFDQPRLVVIHDEPRFVPV
jgi:hypothetical protein